MRARQREREDGSARPRLPQLRATAVQLRHGANDRQAEAGAAVAVPGGGEALEEAIADCGIDAGTVIAHLGDALRTAADLQLDALSLR